MILTRLWAFTIILLNNHARMAAAHIPKGVRRADKDLYSEEYFLCKEDSRRIGREKVNDDYCDCRDGSDEPGTPACSGVTAQPAMFACVAEGYPEQLIFASRVGDGVCDCCDGSDEKGFGMTECEDKCAEVYAAQMAQRQRKIIEFNQASKERESLVEEGQQAKEQRSQKIKAAEANHKKMQLKMSDLEQQLEVAEQEEQDLGLAARSVKTKNIQNVLGINQISDADVIAIIGQLTEQIGKYEELFLWVLLEDNTKLDGLNKREKTKVHDSREEKLEEIGFPEELDELSKTELLSHALQALALKTSMDMRFFALTFIKDVKSVPLFHSLVLKFTGQDLPACLSPDKKEGLDEESTCSVEDLKRLGEMSDALSQLDLSISTEEADQARKNVADTKQAFKDSEDQIAELKKEVELQSAFGYEQQFYYLSKLCAEKEVKEGAFTVCPFRDVKQKDKTQTYNLGSYTGLDPTYTENGLWVMKFEKGQKCWNGPERSTKLYLDCGLATEITEAEEPSMCEYVFVMTTPAACDKSYAQLHKLI